MEYDELNEVREEMKVAYKEGVTAMAELAAAFEAKPKKKPNRRNEARKKIQPEPNYYQIGLTSHNQQSQNHVVKRIKRYLKD